MVDVAWGPDSGTGRALGLEEEEEEEAYRDGGTDDDAPCELAIRHAGGAWSRRQASDHKNKE